MGDEEVLIILPQNCRPQGLGLSEKKLVKDQGSEIPERIPFEMRRQGGNNREGLRHECHGLWGNQGGGTKGVALCDGGTKKPTERRGICVGVPNQVGKRGEDQKIRKTGLFSAR